MNTSARAQPAFVDRATAVSRNGPLLAILGVGLAVRLIFLPAGGFHNDIAAFEAWALTLTEHPLRDFYGATTFADYPPGYFFVLLAVGWIYKALVAVHAIAPDAYNVLGMLVKLPAIGMDVVNAWLLYTIVGRFAARTAALGAAVLYALNPATIYISAYWGQVDSVSWGLVLVAINLLLSSRADERHGTAKVAAAWIVLACSILMKPQGTFVGAVFLAFAFVPTDAGERGRRLRGTLAGLAGAVVVAWIASALFHGTANPVDDFTWLYGRYAYASGVYPYNSVNAFNLYAVKQPFWQSDSQPLMLLGLPLGAIGIWGWLLVVCATVLFVGRYLGRKDDRAFLETAMLVSFGFFILATRMHERYIFGALVLMMPLVAFGRRYVWASIAVSFTLLINLAYSLTYQTVMEAKTPGIDATSLWPLLSGPLSALNVLVFFYLGYVFLGGTVGSAAIDAGDSLGKALGSGASAAFLRARAWFDPREGVTTMLARDWWFAAALTAASLVLCLLWYQWPAERYFDEVYYPRSAAEYLRGVGTAGDLGVFEWTHPPLTKLIVALSMLLFGGLHGAGDTGFGWRFLNIVIGALTVGVLYAFAKHLTRSTLFAAIAAGMLLFDGFHYVQSRIATPEITVAFFSLTTLYAFYRLWIAAQAARRPVPVSRYRAAFIATLAGGTPLAAALAYLATNVGKSTAGHEYYTMTLLVSFAYFETALYLFARVGLRRILPERAADVTYADGTRLRVSAEGVRGLTPEGTLLEPAARSKKADSPVPAAERGLEFTRSYDRDGSLIYATPAGVAEYRVDGSFTAAGIRVQPDDARFWTIALAVSGACLAASKWNGLFDFFVVWLLTAAVVAQRWLRRPAVFGNPFGIALDVIVASMIVVGGAVYIACYIPHFRMGHNLVDVVSMQHEMYWYHSTLSATHPYASKWWQWPILQKPISYYYTDFRPPAARADATACCVAEILALPNPLVWWAGLLSVPIVAMLAWFERNKGYALLVAAYVFQWLPWIGSPRIAFEYHFYPNLSMIVLANAIVLQRVWNWRAARGVFGPPRIAVGTYLTIVVLLFFYFFPVLAGVHVTWNAWHNRMWLQSWII